jgi:chemotaxis protein CheX
MPVTSSAPFDVRASVSETLIEVFDTMLGLAATPASKPPPPASGAVVERVTGCVGLGGEGICGALYIHLPAGLARALAAAMLGMTVEEFSGDTEVNDAVGELCNMVTGGLKSRLCDAGTPCALSIPSVIRGTAYEIQAEPDARKELLLFTCNDQPITVEVHVKFN